MTDAPEPADIDASLTPPTEPDPQQVVAETQKDLTLAGRLGGVKHRDDKVVVFLDENASDELVKIENDRRGVEARIRLLEVVPTDETEDHRDVRIARLAEARDELAHGEGEREAVRVAALQTALAVHLKGFPDVARDAANRKMLGIYGENGRISEERAADAADWLNENLLGHSVVKVVDSDGDVLTLPTRDEVGPMLRKMLPSSQWKLLLGRFLVLATADSYSQAAQDDPGF